MRTIPAFYFDPTYLARVAERSRDSFRTADPFQHVVLDDIVPDDVIELLAREFPGPDDIDWELHGPGRTAWRHDRRVDKLATSDETKFGPFTRHFMGQLNSATFISFLEQMTGTKGIIPDVTYSHCGLHSTGPGGRLMIHTDVNRHPLGCKMHQYLNLILYLNKDWREEYGGHLELWDKNRRPVRRILPSANRMVIFDTGTRSLHGHPHPLTCPPERRRNSIAVYYYLRDRPVSEDYAGLQRSVHWFPTDDEDRKFATTGRKKGMERLQPLRGSCFRVGLDVIPFAVPPALIDVRSRTVPLYFLRPDEFADAETFAARHLRTAIAQEGHSAAEFLGYYQPFALLGATAGNGGADPRAVTCLVDGEGELHVVLGPDAHELFWVGYLDDVLDTLTRA